MLPGTDCPHEPDSRAKTPSWARADQKQVTDSKVLCPIAHSVLSEPTAPDPDGHVPRSGLPKPATQETGSHARSPHHSGHGRIGEGRRGLRLFGGLDNSTSGSSSTQTYSLLDVSKDGKTVICAQQRYLSDNRAEPRAACVPTHRRRVGVRTSMRVLTSRIVSRVKWWRVHECPAGARPLIRGERHLRATPVGPLRTDRRSSGSVGPDLVDVQAAVDAVGDNVLSGLYVQALPVEMDLDLFRFERHHVGDPVDLPVGVAVRPGCAVHVADVVVVAQALVGTEAPAFDGA